MANIKVKFNYGDKVKEVTTLQKGPVVLKNLYQTMIAPEYQIIPLSKQRSNSQTALNLNRKENQIKQIINVSADPRSARQKKTPIDELVLKAQKPDNRPQLQDIKLESLKAVQGSKINPEGESILNTNLSNIQLQGQADPTRKLKKEYVAGANQKQYNYSNIPQQKETEPAGCCGFFSRKAKTQPPKQT